MSDNQKVMSVREMLEKADNPEVFFSNDGQTVMDGTNQDFAFRVSFDIQKGCVPRKMFFKRKGTSGGIGAFFSMGYTVDQFEEKDGIWFPKIFTCIIEYPEGILSAVIPVGADRNSPDMKKLLDENSTKIPKRTIEEKVEFSNIEFSSSFAEKDFRLQTSIPNGTPAYMQDDPHIEHIWLDGKIVPKTDEIMLAIARGGHKFMPGPKEPRFWLMSIGILLILIGGGRLAYKHFTGKD